MKVNDKIMERAGRAIDAGESIDDMVLVMQGAKVALYFGLLGQFFLTSLWLVATEDHLYVMKPQGKDAMTVEARHPRADGGISATKGFPVGALEIGGETFWLPMGQQKKALRIAEGTVPA